jgi:hypothetical protein
MKTLFWILLALCCNLCGCASPKSAFKSSWYFVEEGSSGEPYVAILNQSTEIIHVDHMILNPIGDRPQHGWVLNGIDRVLEPGQLLLRPASAFIRERSGKGVEKWEGCRIPVSVVVVVRPDNRLIHAEATGAMPSSIPVSWGQNCPDP